MSNKTETTNGTEGQTADSTPSATTNDPVEAVIFSKSELAHAKSFARGVMQAWDLDDQNGNVLHSTEGWFTPRPELALYITELENNGVTTYVAALFRNDEKGKVRKDTEMHLDCDMVGDRKQGVCPHTHQPVEMIYERNGRVSGWVCVHGEE